LSAYYLAVLGLILANKNAIVQANHDFLFWTILVFSTLFFALGLFSIFKAIFPYLENNSTDKSLFYYKHVAEMKVVDFLKKAKNIKYSDKNEQLLEQVYANSVIAERKMVNIKNSTRCLGLTLVLILIFLFII
jgi:hypothetical protein